MSQIFKGHRQFSFGTTYKSSLLNPPPTVNNPLTSSNDDLSGIPVIPNISLKSRHTTSQTQERYAGSKLTQQTPLLTVRLALPTAARAGHFIPACHAPRHRRARQLAELAAVGFVFLVAGGCGRQEGCLFPLLVRASEILVS